MVMKHAIEPILQCPITKSSLAFMNQDELNELTRDIRLGRLKYLNGMVVKDIEIEAALISSDRIYIYGVIDGILILLPSLVMVRAADWHATQKWDMDSATNSVMRFYEEIGWQKPAEKLFEDAQRFEDLRPVSSEYIHKCHLRLAQWLPQTGRYLLDAASGPIQYPEYLSYSEGYEYRVCVDLSFLALKAARKNLGDKGIYLQCDITNLPLKDFSMDSFVSLHTIFHIPAAKQLTACVELYRVLKEQRNGAVVYSWGSHSLLMKLFLPQQHIVALPRSLLKRVLPSSIFRSLKRIIKGAPQANESHASSATGMQPVKPEPELYYHPHSRAWYRKEVADRCNSEIGCWRSVSVKFLKTYIHQSLFGRQILSVLFRLESAYPRFFGKYGAYPAFIFTKPTKPGHINHE